MNSIHLLGNFIPPEDNVCPLTKWIVALQFTDYEF